MDTIRGNIADGLKKSRKARANPSRSTAPVAKPRRSLIGYHWRKLAPFSNLRNSWRTFAQANWRIDYDLLETLMGHRLEGVTGRHYLRFTREQIVEQFAREYAESLNS